MLPRFPHNLHSPGTHFWTGWRGYGIREASRIALPCPELNPGTTTGNNPKPLAQQLSEARCPWDSSTVSKRKTDQPRSVSCGRWRHPTK